MHAADVARRRAEEEAVEQRPAEEAGVPPELADLWPQLLRLCHPDVHQPIRQADAHELTIALLEWRRRVEARGGR